MVYSIVALPNGAEKKSTPKKSSSTKKGTKKSTK